ncbi:MAG: DUF1822 family protein [Cyanobacteria bacterium P01_A01_bin.84]
MSRSTYDYDLDNFGLDNFALPLPITSSSREISENFASKQPNLGKAKQVQLNTLAVLVVNDYLQMMGISTKTTSCDAWNPVTRLVSNVADLEIPEWGRVECRPVLPNQEVCHIPPETWEERVGYFAVEIDDSLLEAKILGFVPSVDAEEVPLNQFQAPEEMMDYLESSRQLVNQESITNQLVNLGEWVNGVFEKGWENLESLWNQSELRPAYAFRSADTIDALSANLSTNLIKRAKLIDLGLIVGNNPVILVVEITPQNQQQTDICLQLHPTGNQPYLPEGIHLEVLDESEMMFLEALARSADNYIQLRLHGETDEGFSVRVSLGNASVTESFRI